VIFSRRYDSREIGKKLREKRRGKETDRGRSGNRSVANDGRTINEEARGEARAQPSYSKRNKIEKMTKKIRTNDEASRRDGFELGKRLIDETGRHGERPANARGRAPAYARAYRSGNERI